MNINADKQANPLSMSELLLVQNSIIKTLYLSVALGMK